MSNSIDALQAEYARLCKERDDIIAKAAPLVARREKAVQAAQAASQPFVDEARELTVQIQALRGGERWMRLKREIGALAGAIMALRRARQ